MEQDSRDTALAGPPPDLSVALDSSSTSSASNSDAHPKARTRPRYVLFLGAPPARALLQDQGLHPTDEVPTKKRKLSLGDGDRGGDGLQYRWDVVRTMPGSPTRPSGPDERGALLPPLPLHDTNPPPQLDPDTPSRLLDCDAEAIVAGRELEHDHDVSISVGVDAPGVLEATRRMSAVCEAWGISVLSVREGADEDEEEEEAVADGADAGGEPREGEEDEERGGIVFTQAEESGAFAKENETTAITWPATTQGGGGGNMTSRLTQQRTFLRVSQSLAVSRTGLGFTQEETQDTDSLEHTHASVSFSSTGSIAHFPAFHFNPHALAPLAALVHYNPPPHRGRVQGPRKTRVNVLAAVLETDGPDAVRVRRGPDAGKEVSILRLVLGAGGEGGGEEGEGGAVCKLTAWREVAEAWGEGADRVRRGDVVHLENVLASWEPDTDTGSHPNPNLNSASPTRPTSMICTLTASPALKSKLLICYRTLSTARVDARLRPDLRLGLSDASVRRVATLVRWLEAVAGIS